MIRVVVVDDQAVIRAGLTMILDHEPDVRVVGQAGDGPAAVELATAVAPDVVLMDIRMPGGDGIEATARIVAARAERDRPAVLVLTTFDDEEYVFGALRAGAAGFLLKDAGPDALVAAVRAVAAGDGLVDPHVTRHLVERWVALEGTVGAGPGRPARDDAPAVEALSEREREVLLGLARGLTNRELAAELYLSEATVKSHVSSLLTKLGLRSRVQAVIAAYEGGLVRAGEGRDIRWGP